MTPPEPTDLDRQNAETRRAIAERQEAEYMACYLPALAAFGPGWYPSHRHFLLDKDDEDKCRYTDQRPTPVMTVYTVKNDWGHQRHFTIEHGKVVEHKGYKEGF